MKRHAPMMAVLALLTLTIALLIPGCSNDQTELIPIDVLFKVSQKYSPQISPDGNFISYMGPYEDMRTIWVRTRGLEDDRPLITKNVGSIFKYFWGFDGKSMIALAYQEGVKGPYIVTINTESGDHQIIDLPEPQHRHKLGIDLVRGFADNQNIIYVSMNLRDPSAADLYEVDLGKKTFRLLEEGNSTTLMWLVDHDGNVRGHTVSNDDGGQSFWYRDGNKGAFHEEIIWHLIDDFSWPIWFANDNKTVFLLDSRGLDGVSMIAYDTETKESKILATKANRDLSEHSFNLMTNTPDAVMYHGPKYDWEGLTPDTEEAINWLEQQHTGSFLIKDRTLDDRYWVVRYLSDTELGVFYVFDKQEKTLEKILELREHLAPYSFSKTRTIEYTTRDGLTVEGYLTEPRLGKAPWPTVVIPHGLQHKNDHWSFDPQVQWLADRGYAVIRVNNRGTQGRGKIFMNAGNREIGGNCVNDLADAVSWAIDQGYTDKNKVGVLGSVAGGLAALNLISQNPDMFAMAISVSGYSDLVNYLKNIPPSWERFRTNIDVRIGVAPRYESGPTAGSYKDSSEWNEAEWKEVQFLRSQSPYYHTKDVRTPVMIVHGGKDYLTKLDEMKGYAKKLKDNGVEVEFVFYEDEGQGVSRESNRDDFSGKVETFLAKYLGGRVSE